MRIRIQILDPHWKKMDPNPDPFVHQWFINGSSSLSIIMSELKVE